MHFKILHAIHCSCSLRETHLRLAFIIPSSLRPPLCQERGRKEGAKTYRGEATRSTPARTGGGAEAWPDGLSSPPAPHLYPRGSPHLWLGPLLAARAGFSAGGLQAHTIPGWDAGPAPNVPSHPQPKARPWVVVFLGTWRSFSRGSPGMWQEEETGQSDLPSFPEEMSNPFVVRQLHSAK